MKDKFLKNVANWENHRPLLWYALNETKGDIIEMGCGNGSTPYLQEFAKKTNRKLTSYDFDLEWASKFNAIHVTDWDLIEHTDYSVVLIDHSPGERRWEDIVKLANKCEYMIIHDSEPEATGYMLDKIWHLFKYRRDIKTLGAWATIVSNKFEIPEMTIGEWEVS